MQPSFQMQKQVRHGSEGCYWPVCDLEGRPVRGTELVWFQVGRIGSGVHSEIGTTRACHVAFGDGHAHNLGNRLGCLTDWVLLDACLHWRAGANSYYASLKLLREQYVAAAALCLIGLEGAERWTLDSASPALEPLLHLALGEVLGGCEMAAEQLGGAAGPAQRTMLAEQQQQENLLGVGQSRGNRGFQVVVALLPLARTAAMQHRFDLQRLMDAAPGFTKV